jgi:hypothetical protein
MFAVEKVGFKGWPNCYRIANDEMELIVTTDIGPRIIRLGFTGEANEFAEFPDMVGQTGGDTWRIYGGHRLWHAPEHPVRTYQPDNSPVQFEELDGFVRVSTPADATGIAKSIEIALDEGKNHVRLTHRLHNASQWAIETAPWAISVMATGGVCILPLPPRGTHPAGLLPSNTLTLWPYTNMSDPRWVWGREYIMLRQDPNLTDSQKIGMMNSSGWAGYARGGHLFVKTFDYQPTATYPDMGCNFETYTNAKMLEVETMAPLAPVQPGENATHVENWYLFRGVPQPTREADIPAHVLPHVAPILG